MEPDFDFGAAIAKLKEDGKVSRRGWNGPGQHLKLQVPDVDRMMTLPYISIWTVHGDWVPWLPSHTDMLADDWYAIV